MNTVVRMAIAGMTLSAAGVAGLATHEGWSGTAIRPIPSDPWTICFGNTRWPDGTPVKQGDTATPVQCVQMLVAHAAFDEAKLKQCVKKPVSQIEYDLLVGHAYQFGVGKTCASTLVKKINAEDYLGACNEYPKWKLAGKKDCSIRTSGCYGVYTRALERQEQCLAAQVGNKADEIVEKAESKPTSPWAWVTLALVLTAAGFFVYRRWKK